MALIDKLTAIADAIRGKTGKTEEMTLDQMVTEIEGIQTGGGISTHEQMMIDELSGANVDYKSDKITLLRKQAFRDSVINSVDLPNLTGFPFSGGNGMFEGCTSMKFANIPKLGEITGVCFKNCFNLEKVNCSPYKISGDAFSNCNKLTAVILRSEAIPTLVNTNVFNNTPLTGYGGTYAGHIYVRSSLISEFQNATNWSTLYANYPDIFVAIEGSEYE